MLFKVKIRITLLERPFFTFNTKFINFKMLKTFVPFVVIILQVP